MRQLSRRAYKDFNVLLRVLARKDESWERMFHPNLSLSEQAVFKKKSGLEPVCHPPMKPSFSSCCVPQLRVFLPFLERFFHSIEAIKCCQVSKSDDRTFSCHTAIIAGKNGIKPGFFYTGKTGEFSMFCYDVLST